MRRVRNRDGSTLVELMLGVAIMTVFMAGTVKLLESQTDDVRARSVAETMQSFLQVSAQYFISNRDAMMEAMTSGTGASEHCLIDVDPDTGEGTVEYEAALHTCVFDVSFLQGKGLLPSHFPARTPRGGKLVAVFRATYSGSNPTGGAEMLVLETFDGGAPPGTDVREVATAAELMGGNGGMIAMESGGPCVWDPSSGLYEVCGIGSGWKVNLADFLAM
jgi:type II secretory pathway pseudopilin PulG